MSEKTSEEDTGNQYDEKTRLLNVQGKDLSENTEVELKKLGHQKETEKSESTPGQKPRSHQSCAPFVKHEKHEAGTRRHRSRSGFNALGLQERFDDTFWKNVSS